MEAVGGISTIWQILQGWGPFGVVLVMWWHDVRQMRKLLETYREDTTAMKRMYENNASLVKKYEKIASDLQDVIIMNTQTMTQLVDGLRK